MHSYFKDVFALEILRTIGLFCRGCVCAHVDTPLCVHMLKQRYRCRRWAGYSSKFCYETTTRYFPLIFLLVLGHFTANLHIHQTTGLPIEGRSLVSAGGRSGEGNFICLPAWCLFLRKNLYEHNFMCGCVMKIIF